MDAKIGCQGDAAAKEEERVCNIQAQHGQRRAEAVLDGCRDQVEERQHGEDGDEHGVVDDAGVAGKGIGDHVADKRHDEEGPEELQVVISVMLL